MITVIPAVDIKGGRCVRLHQGRAAQETVYEDDPVQAARRWEQEGATYLHIIDLDGAFTGRPVHADSIAQIIAALSIPVQVGGGLRSDADLQCIVDAGAARMLLGPRACQDIHQLEATLARFGERLAVSIDARQGQVQVQGWTQTVPLEAGVLATRLDGLGVRTLIYTDTAVDGTLQGPNLAAINELCQQVSCTVIAAGGVASADDISALLGLQRPNLKAVIVGKALYEGSTTLSALQAAARAAEA